MSGAPTITSPKAREVLHSGSIYTVKWDTAEPPQQVTNYKGVIYFGHLEDDSENLDIDHPLASGFDLRDGNATITVPETESGNDYIFVLVGDSGNASPTFTIV